MSVSIWTLSSTLYVNYIVVFLTLEVELNLSYYKHSFHTNTSILIVPKHNCTIIGWELAILSTWIWWTSCAFLCFCKFVIFRHFSFLFSVCRHFNFLIFNILTFQFSIFKHFNFQFSVFKHFNFQFSIFKLFNILTFQFLILSNQTFQFLVFSIQTFQFSNFSIQIF